MANTNLIRLAGYFACRIVPNIEKVSICYQFLKLMNCQPFLGLIIRYGFAYILSTYNVL